MAYVVGEVEQRVASGAGEEAARVHGAVRVRRAGEDAAIAKRESRSKSVAGAGRRCGAEYEEPKTEVERKLAGIWEELLGVSRVGAEDNFFELGGDSILSIQVVSRARKEGVEVTAKQMFEEQTVRGLARVAGRVREVGSGAGEGGGRGGAVAGAGDVLRGRAGGSASLQSGGAAGGEGGGEVGGDGGGIASGGGASRCAADEVPTRGEVWKQECVGEAREGFFRAVDVASVEAMETLAEEVQGSLDLFRGRLIEAVLFELGGKWKRLFIVVHHLVVDGVSWRVLLEDVQRAYEQLEAGEAPKLGAKTTSYAAWGRKLVEYAKSGGMQDELGYWKGQGEAEALPVDHPGGANEWGSAASVEVRLTKAETSALLKEVPAAYRTQINEVLLTAVVKGFEKWTGKRTLQVAMEGHGREELFAGVDLSRTVGWFTSVFPVELRLPNRGGLGEELKAVKEQLRAVPNRGLGYGVLRYLAGEGSLKKKASTRGAVRLPRAARSGDGLGMVPSGERVERAHEREQEPALASARPERERARRRAGDERRVQRGAIQAGDDREAGERHRGSTTRAHRALPEA